MGRLSSEQESNGYSAVYSYDNYGNRISKTVNDGDNSHNICYTYDKNSHLVTETKDVQGGQEINRYFYDANGNMTAKQTSTKGSFPATLSSRMALSGRSSDTGLEIYRYDAFNRLTNYNSGSDEASYTYSANNLRASKTVNREKTNFVWNGQNLAAESKANITNTYTYDITGVHVANQNGTVTSYLKDYHGNVIGKTTKTGAMFNEMGTTTDYDAFGNRWQGDVPDPFGYCGEYLDNESGLIYLRNRYYDTTSGRFITEDPVKDGLNWYSYCGGEPVMCSDPSGKYISFSAYSEDYTRIKEMYGKGVAKQASRIANAVNDQAYEYAVERGISAHNTEADDYRHFMWNARLVREIGYYEARVITNMHELISIEDYGWLDVTTRYTTENSPWVYCRMNQESFMDLWNNQVGRELANNKDFAHMNEEELYSMALHNGWLITEANDYGNVFNFLGISECITNTTDNTVDVAWNQDTGNITVYDKNGYLFVTLKIGV